MRPSTIKKIFLAASIILALLIALQTVWLIRIISLSKQYSGVETGALTETNWWMIAEIIALLLMLICLGGLLYYFYRQWQKREVQKDFLNNFMHEFKTPLAVMGIAGRVLLSPGIEQQGGRLRKYAGIIKEQSEELENKVNRILEAALSDKKEIILAKEVVDVNEMIANAISFLQPLISEKSAVIEFTPCPEPLRIYADGASVRQVLINLLDNSLKYATKPIIKVEAVRSDKMCVISVKDNGIGIEKKYHKDIFRKFYRVPTGNVHNVKGFGIGLNFAKKVVDAHHGKIDVYSLPGIGSEFSVQMPLI
jgi:two-component system, OmpR family, phosphate regulon sensor histidine kinase PhoR